MYNIKQSIRTFLLAAFLCSMTSSVVAKNASINLNYPNNRYPLAEKPYVELPIGTITPTGWLQEQMNRMRTGLTGNLDKTYEKVMGKRNAWLGGDGDCWERGPYWIDGLLPLAYTLNDAELKEKVQPWIEWALASQKENGFFGPDTDRTPESGLQRTNSYDWWPRMVVLKVLQQYYSATNDKRVITFMTKYFSYQLTELPKTPLDNWTFWGRQRGGDNLMVVYWLYNITGDKFLLELGELIHKQTLDWTDIFLNQDHLKRPYSLHCVNLGQGFKEPVIYFQQNKDPKQIAAVKKAVVDMRNTIGYPTGLWAGDELLRFGNPTQGSELCTAVEMMFSLEKILEITGDVQWADYLERVTYNALPTQITDNFDARQYYQQLNQVEISRHKRNFVTAYEGTDQLMGELTGYPCCTSNMHQGWPKFLQNLFYATNDNGVAALVYAPSKVKMKVANNILVNIEETTNYPFDESVTFDLKFEDKKIKSVLFPMHFRIPAWCKNAKITVNGKAVSEELIAGQIMKINREWNSNDKVVLELPMDIDISRWYENSAVVERGPLLYALKMNERWEKVKDDRKYGDRFGDWYYEVKSDSPWNYCLIEDHIKPGNIDKYFVVEKKQSIAAYPWTLNDAPITIKAKGKRMPAWTMYDGSVGPQPFSSQYQAETEPEETIELIPYGCTTLRITEFPVTRK